MFEKGQRVMLNESIGGGMFGRGFEKGEVGAVIQVKESWFSATTVVVAFEGGRTVDLKEGQITKI